MVGILPLTFMLALDASPSPLPQPTAQIAAGTYSYVVSIAGQNAGQSTVVVTRDGTTTQIQESTSGNYGTTSGTAKAVLSLGPDLAPTTYQNAYSAGGVSGQTSATFTAAQATVTGSLNGAKTFQLGADAKHFVVIDGAELAGFIALPAQMQAWSNAPALAVFPLYGQTIALTPKAADASQRPATVAATDQGVSVGGPAPFTLWYDPSTFVMDELDVPSQRFIVKRNK
jgi:hypothetical protein